MRLIPFDKTPNPPPASLSDWEAMTALEPALQRLFEEAAATLDNKRNRAFCANAHWYGYGSCHGKGLKPRVNQLVGWHASHPQLRSMEAHGLACARIYSALPDCRNCNCMGM